MNKNTSKVTCPVCQSKDVLPIVYGYPGPNLEEESFQGKVALGGRIIHDENPEWECPACKESF